MSRFTWAVVWGGLSVVALCAFGWAFVSANPPKASSDQSRVNTVVCPDGHHACKIVDCDNMWDKDCLTLTARVCPEKYQVIQTKGTVYVVECDWY